MGIVEDIQVISQVYQEVLDDDSPGLSFFSGGGGSRTRFLDIPACSAMFLLVDKYI
jgi:hypothetical protein